MFGVSPQLNVIWVDYTVLQDFYHLSTILCFVTRVIILIFCPVKIIQQHFYGKYLTHNYNIFYVWCISIIKCQLSGFYCISRLL